MDVKSKVISLLLKTTGVDMKTVQKNDLYTVPPGKVAIITSVMPR